MKHVLLITRNFILAILTLLISQTALAAAAVDTNLAPMLKIILPAVVNLRAQIKISDINTLMELQRQQKLRGQENQPIPQSVTSVGSGVIVDAKNGYILTNAHVVRDAQTIIVTLSDGRRFNAKLVGADKPSDIAVLQIKATNLTAAPLGDSRNLNVGDVVAAIGNPFGLSQTVTSGIISALGRTTLGIENFESFIQTDAPINPGNSGGALINTQGQLIGINTAILAPNQGNVGIGFAIPSNMAKSVMEQLLKFGDVKRGMLGIGAQDVTPELVTAFNSTSTKGAAITQVIPSSPAATGGLLVGDIITAIDGVPVKNASDVVNTVGFLRVDTKINMELLRKNSKLTTAIVLSDPKVREKTLEKIDPYLYGLALSNFDAISPIHGNVRGVAVMDVQADSNAWQADLRPGDIITSANQQPISNINELKAVAARADKMLLINVVRGPSAAFLVINKSIE